MFDLKLQNVESVSIFLNRLLGFPVDLQNQLFEYFTDTFNKQIEIAKQNNTYDLGILGKFHIYLKLTFFSIFFLFFLDFGKAKKNSILNKWQFDCEHSTGKGRIYIFKVQVVRKMYGQGHTFLS